MQRFVRTWQRHQVRSLRAAHQQYSIKRLATMTDTAETDVPTTDSTTHNNSSGITTNSLKSTLTEKLEAEHVDVEDISGGCGQSFEARIVSPLFDKKTTLARHRLVNAALKAEIAAIHAWTPKCFTPEEWERKKSQGQGQGSATS